MSLTGQAVRDIILVETQCTPKNSKSLRDVIKSRGFIPKELSFVKNIKLILPRITASKQLCFTNLIRISIYITKIFVGQK
jgi:hypothetical protein